MVDTTCTGSSRVLLTTGGLDSRVIPLTTTACPSPTFVERERRQSGPCLYRPYHEDISRLKSRT